MYKHQNASGIRLRTSDVKNLTYMSAFQKIWFLTFKGRSVNGDSRASVLDFSILQEQQIYSKTRMLPSQYLKILEVISIEILEGIITKKSDTHCFFKVSSAKADKANVLR